MTLDYRRWIEDEAELARREQQREQEARFSSFQTWEPSWKQQPNTSSK